MAPQPVPSTPQFVGNGRLLRGMQRFLIELLDAVLTQAAICQWRTKMTTVQITLPDQLAQEAQRAGLLSQTSLETMLREKLQMQRQDEFFAAMDRMTQTHVPPAMSPEEVAEEIRALREERRTRAGR